MARAPASTMPQTEVTSHIRLAACLELACLVAVDGILYLARDSGYHLDTSSGKYLKGIGATIARKHRLDPFASYHLGTHDSCPARSHTIDVFYRFELHRLWVNDEEVPAPSEAKVYVRIKAGLHC
jgi:hypothetical protein